MTSRHLAIQRELCRRSLRAFVERGWPLIEPTRALRPSIAVDALCASLQAVADGRIRRLAIACPPGVSKSLITAVAFPAWLMLRSGGTSRVMVGSYAWDFASRDSRRCRDLITSEWFSALVGNAWRLRDDADRRDDYWTTAGGRRLIVSVGGKALGERCTTQIIDDALSGADVHSPAAKRETARWIAEVLPSRLEDPDRDARIVIGQRLAVDDPIAACLERGWTYLCLPAVLSDNDVPCAVRDDKGVLVWLDERQPDEPLVSLLGLNALDKLALDLGSTAYAAQYLQRPTDDAGAVIKRTWWRFYRPSHASASSPRPPGCDAARLGGSVVMIEEESASGAWNGRPGLVRVLDAAKHGAVDAVAVWKLDRWGRSALDVLANIQTLTDAGVRFVAVSQGLDVKPSGDAMSRLMLTVLAAVAEFERDLIRERTYLGLERARAKGIRLGRPPAQGPSSVAVQRLRKQGASWSDVAAKLRCTVAMARRRAEEGARA